MMAKFVWTFVLLAAAIASAEEPLGIPTSIEDFPSIGQVEARVGSVWVLQCACSVITNRHVLAPASCFSNEDNFAAEYYRVRVGTSYRGVDGEIFEVETLVRQPNYGLQGSDGDLCVVRLREFLTLGPLVQQTQILAQDIELPDGLELLSAGWGITVQGGESPDDNLYSLKLVVHNYDNCLEAYIEDKIITKNMLCAGLQDGQGRDFDEQDLGAPVQYSNTLVGILVTGAQTNDELPLVATKIGSYTDWIVEVASA